jgi:hypothetical protein
MIKEIGSFIELDLRDSGEYFTGGKDIVRLNSARAGIYHSCKLCDCKSVYIPYYLCSSVKSFLLKQGIEVIPYYINDRFEPINIYQQANSAFLIVNYFGILSIKTLTRLASLYKNVIIDNSAGFFTDPVPNCYNVYSPRKFFGVPDGCYIIGEDVNRLTEGYEQDVSSDTASFLLKRIEYGLTSTYSERMRNEERINNSGTLMMSTLTRALLKSIDYASIKTKRKENFNFAHSLYKGMNMFSPTNFIDTECVPMIYPLVLEDRDLIEKLKGRKIYIGRLWNHVLTEVPDYSFEARLSNFLIPVPVDQRYRKKELDYCHKMLCLVYTPK